MKCVEHVVLSDGNPASEMIQAVRQRLESGRNKGAARITDERRLTPSEIVRLCLAVDSGRWFEVVMEVDDAAPSARLAGVGMARDDIR